MAYSFNPFTGKLDDVGAGGGGTTDASLLTSGTLADARLSANVPLIASANSFTAGQTITAAANTSALTASYSVTGANTTPLLNLSGTWNTTGVATGLKLNITDTASNASSLLMDLQVGGTSKFQLFKSGNIVMSSGAFLTGGFVPTGTDQLKIVGPDVLLGSTNGTVSWTNGAVSTAVDLVLRRDAANTLAQRNGTSANTLRVYNTYTDASNYERGVFDWTTTANVLTIGTQKAGTGTARRVRINSAEQIDFYCTDTSRMFQVSTSTVTAFNSFNWQWYSASADPTTSTTPFNNGTSTCGVFKNTTTGLVKLWVNDGGTMKSVTLV